MNANEHLDFYNPDSIYYGNSRHYIQQLENKVRQQQAEIEALKTKMSLNNYDDVKNVANQLFNEKISLRDYFAAKAMQGLIAGCYAGNNVGFTVGGNVFAAYEYADEMIKAQDK